MKILFAFVVGFLTAYIILDCMITEKLKSEIFGLRSDIENIENFRQNPIFKTDNTNLCWEIYDLKNRAENLKFCCQCPLYQKKVQEDMQQTFQEVQE